jgi:hypothetical protein
MKRSRFLTLSAMYLAANFASHSAHSAMTDSTQQQAANDAVTFTPATTPKTSAEVAASTKLADEFATLAGSQDNAEKLVVGLRNAKPVTMKEVSPVAVEVSFSPPTRPLSFSDVHKALSLAQAQLKSKNIESPTPAQLKASLAGGELPNAHGDMTHIIGILPLHKRGMSWDQIARVLRVAPPKRVVGAQDSAQDPAQDFVKGRRS